MTLTWADPSMFMIGIALRTQLVRNVTIALHSVANA